MWEYVSVNLCMCVYECRIKGGEVEAYIFVCVCVHVCGISGSY